MFCVNYINEYTATYLRRGVDNFDKLKYKDVTETVTGDDMCIVVHAEAKKEQVWDNQFWIDAVDPFEEKQTISITMDVKATKAAKATTQVHEAPGSYKGGGFGDVNFTTEWTTVNLKGTIASGQAGGHSIALNLSEFAEANDYYFDNISLKVNDIENIRRHILQALRAQTLTSRQVKLRLLPTPIRFLMVMEKLLRTAIAVSSLRRARLFIQLRNRGIRLFSRLLLLRSEVFQHLASCCSHSMATIAPLCRTTSQSALRRVVANM